jgi:hypothetical protein
MDSKTLKALKNSIRHWEDNVSRAKKSKCIDTSLISCALCRMFYCCDCRGCPVYKKSHYKYCGHTYYYSVRKLIDNGSVDDIKLVKACKKELNFLKSLLPN